MRKQFKKFMCVLLSGALILTTIAIRQHKAVQAAPAFNYGEALQKSVMFFEFQRSGSLPQNKRDNWRGNSGMTDGADVGLDLTGGLYDAGDHVKFNLPMAYTATMLAWSVYESRDAYVQSGQLQYALDNIKWITDYLIKCHPSPNVFYYQVGSGHADHAWWGPAEVMQMARPSYRVDLANPGSAVVAEAAAALAAAAVVFRTTDPAYAALCVQHAKDLFNFADITRSDRGYTAASGFYNSWSGFWDELSWAATWIYLATNDNTYLVKAESYVPNWEKEGQSSDIKYTWTLCWDAKHYGAQLLLARITNKAIYKESMERNLDWWTTGYNGRRITYTPKGLAWLDTWGSLRYATTAAFMAEIYSNWSGCTPTKVNTYKNFAKSQVDYALGSTGRSFMVGFGVNPPMRPHHRTAHGSWADSQTVPNYHRHTIYGALVGGPNASDAYIDDIGNYQTNEIACDYNAGITGVLAELYKRHGGNPIPNFNAIEPITEDEFFVEAGVNASGANFIEIRALLNNRSAWPAKMGDKLSFRYFVDITELVNAGYSANDVTTSTNYNAGATVSRLIPWDAARNIYYVNVDFTGTKIYPGGQQHFRKEVQFRLAAPLNTNIWSNANDFSYVGIGTSSSPVKVANIPVYDNGVKVFGNEPTGSGTPIQQVATPTFSIPGGTYTSAQTVAISCATPGATIRYTTNGANPTSSSPIYTGPITVSSTTTIRAVAMVSGMANSNIASATYTISTPVNKAATPTFSVPGGTYTSAQTVAISTATAGATIYYTTNGTTPTTSSTIYTGPITVSSTTTVRAMAVASGMTNSDVASATYTINTPVQKVATPTFSVPGGTYTSAQTVAISTATAGATIYYTTNGTTPTTSSTLYTGPITVSSTTTVRAIAVATGMTNSDVSSVTYTISTPVQTGIVVTYTVLNDWGSGATVEVKITNNGTAPINGWTLNWAFAGNQRITNLWNGTYTQSGGSISVRNMSYNGTIAANGGTQSFGFNISYSGTNARPTSFTLNGIACQVQ